MNQRGFVTVTMLALLPLLMTIVAVTLSLWLLMKSDARAKHRCRMELLTSQNEVLKSLDSLLALNAPAKALRLRKKLAEAMRDVGTPPQRIKAEALILIIERQQQILDRQQKTLLARGFRYSTQEPWSTSKKVQLDFETHSRTVESSFGSKSEARAFATVGSFAMLASPQGEVAPEYYPSPGFEKKQVVRADWHVPVSSLFPEWAQTFIPSAHGLRLKGHCSVSIRQNERSNAASRGGKKWQVHLEVDK